MSKNSHSEKPKKLKNKKYTKQLRKLQAELCKLQDWVKHKGLRFNDICSISPPPARS